MTVNNTESLDANSSSETRSVFYCPKSPHFIWNLNHTTSIKIVLAITAIACPVIILLNLLVIIAVKTRRELKKNSNILLSSLAVADLLVGAVSMPLSITLDVLVLQRNLVKDTFCSIDLTSDFVLYTVFLVSFLHLVLIAWDRHVAIVKWMEYKVIVTKGRVKKYKAVAWLLPLSLVASMVIVVTFGVRCELKVVLEVIGGIFWAVCPLFIVYYYVKVYLEVRRHNRTQIRSVNALVRAKLERKIAYTTFWITLFVCISGAPSVVVFLCGRIWPFLRKSPVFRSTEAIFQLNSIVNPLLYFYRNRQLRKAAMELLRCRKPQRFQPVTRPVRRVRQRRYSVASLDVEKLQIGQNCPRLTRLENCHAVMCSDTVQQSSNEKVNERPISTLSKTANDKVFTQQPNKHVVTVQIESAPRMKRFHRNTVLPTDTTKLKRSPHRMVGKIARSTSLNENFVTLTNSHQYAAQKNFKRSRSLPILSTTSHIGQQTNCY